MRPRNTLARMIHLERLADDNLNRALSRRQRSLAMLILTREIEQSVIIGDPNNPTAVVKIFAIGRSRVRVGVEAPGLEITRSEIQGSPTGNRSSARARSRRSSSPQSLG